MVSDGQAKSLEQSQVTDSLDGTKEDPERPPINILKDIKDAVQYLVFNPEANHIVMPLVVIAESIALKWIIANVDYTEIDYKAYMEQIWTVQDGERNYSLIEGGTGPLVYPAGHVMVYKWMHSITGGLDNLKAGQTVFRYLYLATMMLQMVCYVLLQLPPWCVVLASLSKRLHSIYVLRLFNDCFTTFFLVLTVLSLLLSARLQRRSLCLLASCTYTVALSIKMNALLYLPGVLLSVFQLTGGNLFQTVCCVAVMAGWQVYVARSFILGYALEYWGTAFNFGRQFMYKWSINWQFVEEEVFQDQLFQRLLLASHIVALAVFVGTRFFPYTQQIRDSLRALCHPFSRVLERYPRPLPLDIGCLLYTSRCV